MFHSPRRTFRGKTFRTRIAGLSILFACAIASSGAAASASNGVMSLSEIPELPKPQALLGVQESPILAPPVQDAAGRISQVKNVATKGMPPGKVTGGPRPRLEIRPAVPAPDQRLPLPQASPSMPPEKPILTLPSQHRIR